MSFYSVNFAAFVILSFIIYWLVKEKYKWLVLLFSNYIFYLSFGIDNCFILFLVTIISFYSAKLIKNKTHSKFKEYYLIIGIVLTVAPLLFFKYFNTVIDFLKIQKSMSITAPIGLSFFTFQAISYIVDIYRNRTDLAELKYYFCYLSFFPTILSGPIERANEIIPQIKIEKRFDYDNATYGLKLFAIGMLKKYVIANTFSYYVDFAFTDISNYHGFSLLILIVFYSFQIYADFSGYSDMARGISKLFDIELIKNFDSPYFSTSIKEFWSKWHISLSLWLRDYVYIPLGGNKKGKLRKFLNMIITFLVSGLWHGTGINFIIWGLLHASGQIFEDVLGIKSTNNKRSIKWWARVLLLNVFICFTWVFFRSNTLDDCVHIFRNILVGIESPVIYLKNGFKALNIKIKDLKSIVSFLLMLLVYDYASMYMDVILFIRRKNVLVRNTIYIALIILILFFNGSGGAEFVYFQF